METKPYLEGLKKYIRKHVHAILTTSMETRLNISPSEMSSGGFRACSYILTRMTAEERLLRSCVNVAVISSAVLLLVHQEDILPCQTLKN